MGVVAATSSSCFFIVGRRRRRRRALTTSSLLLLLLAAAILIVTEETVVDGFAPPPSSSLRRRQQDIIIISHHHHHRRRLCWRSTSTTKQKSANSNLADHDGGGDADNIAAVVVPDSLPPLSAPPQLSEASSLVQQEQQQKQQQQEEIDDDDDDEEEQTYKTAFRNTLLSIGVSILFGAGLWMTAGQVVGEEFFAGYIVEKSLSVDNLFVFLLLFDFFDVPSSYQNRVLTWGIYGSVIMRSIMIALGAAALQNFRGILLIFAGILIYSALQVLVDVEQDEYDNTAAAANGGGATSNDLSFNPVVMLSRSLCESNDSCDIDEFDNDDGALANPVVMFSRSLIPSTTAYDGDRFFTIENGVKKATPLFVCMVAVELSDVVFAVDSIPAVFGVTEVRKWQQGGDAYLQ